MDRATRSRWRFEPQRSFANAEARRLYQSFVWSVWLLLIVLPPLLATPIMAGEDRTITLSPVPVIGLALGCVVIAAVLGRWLIAGFNLRERRVQAQAAAMFVIPVAMIIAAWAADSYDERLTLAAVGAVLFITALTAATITGPNGTAVVVAVVAGLVCLAVPGIHIGQVIGVAIWVGVMWAALKMSIWYVDVVRDLDEARETEARLAVAEERLRFSTDLHDVMGRSLAAISLKAQLADRLLSTDEERARQQLSEISDLAASSLTDVRALVRGYRGLDLEAEISGAVSLLGSAGARVSLTGRADELSPDQAAHTAALIREATTNILHHSDAEHVSIEISPSAVRISSDRPRPQPTSRSGTGLDGLARRLEGTGTLRHHGDGEHFVLELNFQEQR